MASACDLLVIGLGPAGGAAAAAAAQRGLSVLAVEKKTTVGVPVQCAEFIPLPMGRYARAEGVLLQRISGMKSYLPSGTVAATGFPGLMVDRAAFDQALARQARDAGARLLLGSRLAALDARSRRARIATANATLEVAFELVVAADGPRSRTAECLGLPQLPTVNTRQYTVPLRAPCSDTDIWLSDAYPGGYAWLFPKAEWANLGLGADKRFASDLKAPLDALHARLVREGVLGETISCRTGGTIPVGGLRESLALGPVMFAGDAAGLTHPISGAGIAAAVVSGERAGQAAAEFLKDGNGHALFDYEQDVRDQFESAIARAVERRRWLDAVWHTPEAAADGAHRRGWIAFPEYFAS